MSVTIISGVVICVLSYAYDPSGTLKLISVVVSIRGVSWLAKKITHSMNPDSAQIIDFAGWSMAGLGIVGIIKNAMRSMNSVSDFFNGTASFFGKVAWLFDKITFWN